ncbi:MAG TPA: LLM class F420-dependent oxidoreductase [Candidatus Binataceae bacterium]|jgi:probable F420-dependent oxidoreductase|nr:LLM class F420-dependent oxidoreductase [Candidatus Binataceae bacterium]
MEVGVSYVPTWNAIYPAQLAMAAEERGLDALFVPEHTHVPVNESVPWPPQAFAEQYKNMFDNMIALSTAAAVTRRIKVGTSICLVTEHDPIVLAKQVASLDRLSGGRFVFGVGSGGRIEEMAHHGVAWKNRWKVFRERIEAMKQIWANEEAEYHGEFVNFDAIRCPPRPVQKPHPPILLGAMASRSLDRIVDYCDGWLPQRVPIETFKTMLKDLRGRAEARGRDPKTIRITVHRFVWQKIEPEKAALDEYAREGVERVIYRIPSEGKEQTLARLDQLAGILPVGH